MNPQNVQKTQIQEIDHLAALLIEQVQGARQDVSFEELAALVHPPHRLVVYRDSILSHVTQQTEPIFAGLRQLIGPAFFERLIKSYLSRTPLRHRDLIDDFFDFPEFLDSYTDLEGLDFLSEVARWEWMRAWCEIHENFKTMEFSQWLQNLALAEASKTTLQLKPGILSHSFSFAIDEFYQALRSEDEKGNPELAKLVDSHGSLSEASTYAVWSVQGEARSYQLSETQAHFLSLIQRGATLERINDYYEQNAPTHFYEDLKLFLENHWLL